MTEAIERLFEYGTSIFIIVLSATLTSLFLYTASEPIIIQGTDKTYVDALGVQEWETHEKYGRDILFSLINTDIMSPYPRAIKINDTPVIKIDNLFLTTKMRNVAMIYSSTGEYKLSTMLDWKVTSEKYVYDDGDFAYIHYTLEEVS